MARSSSRPSTRKFWQAAQSLQSGFSRQGLYWLLRSGLVTGRKEPGGFILPTVTLLLLMVSLVVGMLVYRTFTRTSQVIGQRQQRVLYNAATPAIEIGKSKLEYLFTQAGLPALPTDEDLVGELSDTQYDLTVQGAEQRLDINNDGQLDNAWLYTTDANGDGIPESVAYSLLTRAAVNESADNELILDANTTPESVALESADEIKASALVVRNGPLIATQAGNANCPSDTTASPIAGWEKDASNTSKIRKALQIHAVVLNRQSDGSVGNSVAATLEMQQDRQVDYGNKWGAWFRYDLGAWSTETFRFNGAMHTDGSFILGGQNTNLYLVSAPESCVFDKDASVLTMAGEAGNSEFLGHIMVGKSEDDTSADADSVAVHTHQGSGFDASQVLENRDTGNNFDSVDGTSYTPSDIMLNPVALFTGSRSESLGSDTTNQALRDANWGSDQPIIFNRDRVYNQDIPAPFLDDTYRADDRWGPSPVYKEPGTDLENTDTVAQDGICFYASVTDVTCGTIGDGIGTLNDMVRNEADESNLDESSFGLDGYWERRARRYGVRIIVGQRLELGNAQEWLYEDTDGNGIFEYDGTDADGDTVIEYEDRDGSSPNGFLDIDPLYPPGYTTDTDATVVSTSTMSSRANELQQMRTLRDNLSAVQATAVYHYQENSGNYPVACLATTAHPGTSTADQNSRSFTYIDVDGDTTTTTDRYLYTDFLTGEGTNGIEFTMPFTGAADPAATFEAQIEDVNSPLRLALANLAYFAGDPKGAFPPTQDASSGQVHPYPLLSMWGNQSELRRVISNLPTTNDATAYDGLSIADKSTLHTATCTLGMLAYNLQLEDDLYQAALQDEIDSLTTELTLALSDFDDNAQSLAVHARYLLNGDEYLGDGYESCLTTFDSADKHSIALLVNCSKTPEQWWASEKGTAWPYGTGSNSSQWATVYSNFLDDGTNSFDYFSSFTPDEWESAYQAGLSTQDLATYNKLKNAIDAFTDISLSASVTAARRDRTYGFSAGDVAVEIDVDQILQDSGTSPLNAAWDGVYNYDPSTGTITDPNGSNLTYPTGCDPYSITYGISSQPNNANATLGMAGLAQALCGEFIGYENNFEQPVRYPALYYLFPFAAHYHNGAFLEDNITYNGVTYSDVDGTAATEEIPEVNQAVGDTYPTDTYILSADVNGSTSVAGSNNAPFLPVEDGLSCTGSTPDTCSVGTQNGVVDGTEAIGTFVTYLGVRPVQYSDSTTVRTVTNWSTPVEQTATTDFAGDRHLIQILTRFTDDDSSGSIDDADLATSVGYLRPGIIDMALYNGRELMSVRTLSLDLNQMRRKAPGNSACSWELATADTDDSNGDCWLPLPTILEPYEGSTTTGALIYAFREDAVREDAIARPTSTSDTCTALNTATTGWLARWRQFVTETNLPGNTDLAGYLMDAADQPSGQQDPQRNPCTGVSPKPVDFYPDPGRRPYGFVLQNGEDLRRGSGSTWDTDGRGISFVSDQPVYIWGDFNLHSTDGTTANLIEEFTDLLTESSWANFYTRTRTTLNTNFARPASDTWRASEVIADLVYVLSDAFIPGYVADGITWNSNAAGSSSYGNMPLLESDAGVAQGGIKNWMRENGKGSDVDPASPIKLSHRGFPFFLDSGAVREYGTATDQNFEPIGDTDRAARIDFTNLTHYVNTVVIGAIPPARVNQPYGELTNHLRFIENWDGSTLNFKGSLAQFTFSTYSGPHDQDSWEPGTQATGTSLTYYGAPSREWGFDVGLLYNPPGAIAQRLSVPSKVRSEFYREPAVDDAYIMNLRCAWVDSDGSGTLETDEQVDTNRVDSRLTATECPAP